MKTLSIVSSCLLFALAASARAQIQTQLGDVTDTRTTGRFFQGLQVEVKLLGDELADAKFMRTTVSTAVDDTGRDLVDHDEEKKDFEKINIGQNTHLTLRLKNPARKAATLKEVSGQAELFVPQNDPDSVVKVDEFQKTGGQPVVSPVLTAAGVEIITYTKEQAQAAKAKAAAKNTPGSLTDAVTDAFGGMMGMGGSANSITVQTKDPGHKLVGVEFQDENGEEIKTRGWSAWGEEDKKTRTYDFNGKLPEKARLVIYVATPKAVVKAPFDLTNVYLP